MNNQSNKKPTPKPLTDKERGPWVLNEENRTLEYRPGSSRKHWTNPYYIDLDECTTPEGSLDWLAHATEKYWDNDAALGGLLRLFRAHLGRSMVFKPGQQLNLK